MLIATQLLAEDQALFLGEDFLPWMVLAFGAALVVGNLLALVRPPTQDGSQDDAPDGSGGASNEDASTAAPMARPPIGRTVVMIVVGLVAAAWGLASLLA